MKGREDERVKYNEKKIYIMFETLDILISFIGFEFSCKVILSIMTIKLI